MRSQLTPDYLKTLHGIMKSGGEKVSNRELTEAMVEEGLAKPTGSDLCKARVAVFGKRSRALKKNKRIKTDKAGKLRPAEKLREIITMLGRHATTAEIRRHLAKDGYKEPSGTRIKKVFEELYGVTPVTQSAKIPKRTLAKATAVAASAGVAAISDKMKFDLIQVKETAQLVGGLDQLIELATWLKNWQL